MKIARVLTDDDTIATVELVDQNNAYITEGDLENGFKRTDRSVRVKSFLSPIQPPCIYGVGLNYKKHAEETGKALPTLPLIFIKAPNATYDPGKAVEIPAHKASSKVDYECELAIVIGKRAKNVSESEALEHVFGYTVGNDISARDWQFEYGQGQFCQGKSFDTFCPLGPWIVTSDEIDNPDNLRLSMTLNGETMQDSRTSDMIFSVAQIVSFLSGSKTLLPGTVILSGTPSGVGTARNPPRYLRAGDQMELTIEKIGTLRNSVIDEPLG